MLISNILFLQNGTYGEVGSGVGSMYPTAMACSSVSSRWISGSIAARAGDGNGNNKYVSNNGTRLQFHSLKIISIMHGKYHVL